MISESPRGCGDIISVIHWRSELARGLVTRCRGRSDGRYGKNSCGSSWPIVRIWHLAEKRSLAKAVCRMNDSVRKAPDGQSVLSDKAIRSPECDDEFATPVMGFAVFGNSRAEIVDCTATDQMGLTRHD